MSHLLGNFHEWSGTSLSGCLCCLDHAIVLRFLDVFWIHLNISNICFVLEVAYIRCLKKTFTVLFWPRPPDIYQDSLAHCHKGGHIRWSTVKVLEVMNYRIWEGIGWFGGGFTEVGTEYCQEVGMILRLAVFPHLIWKEGRLAWG